MLAVAFPHASFFEIGNVFGSATRASYLAVGPAQVNHRGMAVLILSEVYDCFLKSAWRFHNSSMPEPVWSVKYIYALRFAILCISLFPAFLPPFELPNALFILYYAGETGRARLQIDAMTLARWAN